MKSDFDQLQNNNTLAPLKEFYQTKSLPQKDANILANISKSSIQSIESAIGSLTHLITNLKVYKECMIDSINLQTESADITSKYSFDPPQQSHSLPGIVSLPQSFDLNAIRSDNERMMQVKEEKDKALKQKEIYIRLAEEDVRLFLASWKRLNYSNASFDEFVETLNAQFNKNY